MEFEIIDAEEIDHNSTDDEECGAGSVSVLVTVRIEGKEYFLDFQTSTTLDYGAISSDLEPYQGNDDFEEIREMFEEDSDAFSEFIDKIKEASGAQKLWDDYIEENYIRDIHFNGIDANSECNSMTRKK